MASICYPKLKATIVVPDSPKPSEASEGLEYEPTPSTPAFGASGARGGGPGPSTARALRKRTAQKAVYSGYGSDELEDEYRVTRLLYFFL